MSLALKLSPTLFCATADRVELFVHISTSEVYGTAASKVMDEDHPLNPMSPYAAAKCGADRLVYSYWTTYRIPTVIIRPFNNFGPYQHLEKVVPTFHHELYSWRAHDGPWRRLGSARFSVCRGPL